MTRHSLSRRETAVAETQDSALEPVFVEEFEVDAAGGGQRRFSAANHHGPYVEPALVNQPSCKRLRSEIRTPDGEVILGRGLELAYRNGIKTPFNPCSAGCD